MTRKILVSIDLSEDNAFDRLMPVAESLGGIDGAELHVLSVVPTFNMSIVGSYFSPEHEKEALANAQKILGEKINSRNYAGALKGHIAQGIIYEEIIKAANTLECDLIVIAANRPELKDYLLGPNAARVARHAKQSVFVVRDDA
jgi:nucleotide-binding universal stress UspA family protein